MKYSDTQLIRATFTKTHDPLGVRVCEENLDEIRSYEDCKIIAYKGRIQNVEIKKEQGYAYASPGNWILEDNEGRHYRKTEEELKKKYTLT